MSGVTINTRDTLTLKQAMPGAMMWAVGLGESHAYVFPDGRTDTVFPEHLHEVEQITLRHRRPPDL